jgi:hypothetical protein
MRMMTSKTTYSRSRNDWDVMPRLRSSRMARMIMLGMTMMLKE